MSAEGPVDKVVYLLLVSLLPGERLLLADLELLQVAAHDPQLVLQLQDLPLLLLGALRPIRGEDAVT